MRNLYASAYGTARHSGSREVIAETARDFGIAFTVDDLAEAVRAIAPAAGAPATVYRAVSAMADNGFLVRVGERNGAALYAHCDSPHVHHHHVVCDGCGKTVRAECPLETAALPGPEGFVITRHEVTLYGLCPDCARKER